MKITRGVIILSVLVSAAFLLMRHSKPSPQHESSGAGPEKAPTKLLQRRDENLPDGHAKRDRWQEMLPVIQGRKELFGAHSEQRMKEMQEFVETLPLAALPDALKELHELQARNPTDTGKDLEARLVRRWADSNPHSAATWVAESEGANREDLLGIVAGFWARKNRTDAATWASQLTDDGERQNAIRSVAYEGIDTHPEESLKLAIQLPADPGRDQVIASASAAWASRAPKEAVAWASRLPEDQVRQQAVSAIAMTWAANDPSAAANLAIGSLPPGELQEHTVLAIARRWALIDPAPAREWIKRFPEGTLRTTALEGIAADQLRVQGAAPRD